MKLKNILFLCMLLCTIHLSKAQNNQDTTQNAGQNEQRKKLNIRDKISFNIGGGLWFGSYTNISLLPQIGYRVTDKLTTGVGVNFHYYKNNTISSSPYMIYGGNVFARYFLLDNLFTQAEYQLLQYDNFLGDYALLGGGYRSMDGFYISGYYLLRYPSNNAYGAPYIIRIGFLF